MGTQQFAEVHHPDVVNWLAWLVELCDDRSPLWPSTPARFRLMFHSVCSDLGISELKLSPASLRAGGATWMLDERCEVSRIRSKGRWTNLRSLEHYLQVARAQQITLCLPPRVIARLKLLLVRSSFCRNSFQLECPRSTSSARRLSALVAQPMSLVQSEIGEGWEKAFKKAVISGGPLKGARFTDVSWDDLKKSARSYRSDPRFNQYAKRRLSERALASNAERPEVLQSSRVEPGSRCSRLCRGLGHFLLARAKVKFWVTLLIILLFFLLLSRPLFYVVVAKMPTH